MRKMVRLSSRLRSDISQKKKYLLGLGPGCEPKSKPKTKINSEFNSIHFCVDINKIIKNKIFETQKCQGLKMSDFFQNS